MISRPVILALVVLVGLASGAGAEPAADTDRRGDLVQGDWQGTALGRRTAGGFLVLSDSEGFMRGEIGLAPADDLRSLLERRGQGWTVVAGPTGGTRNQWDREWRPLEPRLISLLLAGAELLARPRDGAYHQRQVILDPEGASPLRNRLAARGRGRGGPGEVLDIRGEEDGSLTLSSSRRPGSLRLTGIRRYGVSYPVLETFAPLWPLAELVEPEEEFPGTPGLDGR